MTNTGFEGMGHPGLLQASLGPTAIQPGYVGQPGLSAAPNTTIETITTYTTTVPAVGGLLPGAVINPGAIGQPLIGQSLVGRIQGVGATNQFVQSNYGYNQQGCTNCCPWWLWLLLGLLLIGGFIAGLTSLLRSRKNKNKRRYVTKTVIRQQIKTNTLHPEIPHIERQNNHLRYSVSEWM